VGNGFRGGSFQMPRKQRAEVFSGDGGVRRDDEFPPSYLGVECGLPCEKQNQEHGIQLPNFKKERAALRP
jgi:hypothetical protein